MHVRRGFRHPNRLLVFGGDESERGSLSPSTPAGPEASVAAANSRAGTADHSVVLALQGYLQDTSLIQLDMSSGSISSIYATRTCPSPLSCQVLYQVALVLWVFASFLAWSIVAFNLLFVVIYGLFTRLDGEGEEEVGMSAAHLVRARGLAMLAALTPVLLYVLSLIAFHLWLAHDIFLDLTHTGQSVEFALARSCGCWGVLQPRSRVASCMRMLSWLLLAGLLALYCAVPVGVGLGMDASTILANSVIIVMAAVATLHALTTALFPCLRYCAFQADGVQDGHTSALHRSGQCCRELWLRGGLVCGNMLTGLLAARCICWSLQDDMDPQAELIAEDMDTYRAFGAQRRAEAADAAAAAAPQQPVHDAERYSVCCITVSPSHTGLWAPTSCVGMHRAATLLSLKLHRAPGASDVIVALLSTALAWTLLALFVNALFSPHVPLAALAVGATCSLLMLLCYLGTLFALWCTTREGDAVQQSCACIPCCSQLWAAARRASCLTRAQAAHAWFIFPQYRITAMAVLVGGMATLATQATDGSIATSSAGAAALVSVVVLLFVLPIAIGVFQSWQLGLRCCWCRCTGADQAPSVPCCLVDSLGRLQSHVCLTCGPTWAARSCASVWCWYSCGLVTVVTFIVLFGTSVFAALPAIWLAMLITTILYAFVLCNAVPTHSLNLTALASSSPGLQRWEAACSTARLEEVEDLRKAGASAEPVQPVPDGGDTADVGEVKVAVEQVEKRTPADAAMEVDNADAAEEWLPRKARTQVGTLPFASQQVPLNIQAGQTRGDTYTSRGMLAEDVNAFAASRTEAQREQYGKAHGGNSSFVDPVQTNVFIERHLRWKLVMPCFVFLCVLAFLLISLVDQGVRREGGAFEGWSDASRPILPQPGHDEPALAVCGDSDGGLTPLDFALLSKAVYLGAKPDAYGEALRQLLPGMNVTLHRLAPERLHEPLYSVLTLKRPAGTSPQDVLDLVRGRSREAVPPAATLALIAEVAAGGGVHGNATSQDALAHIAAIMRQANPIPAINTTVLTIRGSLQGFDWAQNAFVWGNQAMVQGLSFVVPFLWPLRASEADVNLVGILGSLERAAFTDYEEQPRAFYVPVARQLTALALAVREGADLAAALARLSTSRSPVYNHTHELGSSLAVTGHSLGGGVAMIAGPAAQVPAHAFSAPGPLLGRLKFQRAVQAGCPNCEPDLSAASVAAHAANVMPEGDIVPWVGGQPTRAVSVGCGANPVACHRVVRTMCTMMQSCGDVWGRNMVSFAEPPEEQPVTMSECCIQGHYSDDAAACKALLCSTLNARPDLDTTLRRLC